MAMPYIPPEIAGKFISNPEKKGKTTEEMYEKGLPLYILSSDAPKELQKFLDEFLASLKAIRDKENDF